MAIRSGYLQDSQGNQFLPSTYARYVHIEELGDNLEDAIVNMHGDIENLKAGITNISGNTEFINIHIGENSSFTEEALWDCPKEGLYYFSCNIDSIEETDVVYNNDIYIAITHDDAVISSYNKIIFTTKELNSIGTNCTSVIKYVREDEVIGIHILRDLNKNTEEIDSEIRLSLYYCLIR